jgi:sulfatase modifying factor 1
VLAAAAVLVAPAGVRAFVSPSLGASVGCGIAMAMIPAGSYTLGEKKNTATIAAFCMDRTEVTVDAYAACVSIKVCGDEGLTTYPSATWGKPGKGRHPINSITWWQANTFCISQGKRLPTEEEWEWAARGGPNGWAYPWGNEPIADQWCWSGVTPTGGTCAVASFPPNIFGVHDLAGNLWEWTSSKRELYGAKTWGLADPPSYVFRGGSWGSTTTQQARVDLRGGDQPDWRDPDVGFRCVKSL